MIKVNLEHVLAAYAVAHCLDSLHVPQCMKEWWWWIKVAVSCGCGCFRSCSTSDAARVWTWLVGGVQKTTGWPSCSHNCCAVGTVCYSQVCSIVKSRYHVVTQRLWTAVQTLISADSCSVEASPNPWHSRAYACAHACPTCCFRSLC